MFERLKKTRIAAGYTQYELSKIVGITRTAYTNYELGIREPSTKILLKLSDALGVSIEWLMTGKNFKPNIFLKEINSYFNDKNVPQDEKEKLILSINELYYKSK